MNSNIIIKHLQDFIAIYCKFSICALILLLLSGILTSCGGNNTTSTSTTTSSAAGYVLSFNLNGVKEYLVMSCNIGSCTDLSNSIVWSNESGTTVSIDGLATTTDSTGHWQINNIPIGTYPIYVNSSLDFDRDGCAIYSGTMTTSFIFDYYSGN